MRDLGSNPDSPELIMLVEGIREMLAVADSLGLAFVGIHLCNALEALQEGTLTGGKTVGPSGPSDSQY